MRALKRFPIFIAALGLARAAWAGPGSASGPIAIDSMTFVPSLSVIGTGGGVYGDAIPPIASTTTAAFRMTAYRAQHVNLRDNSGAALGVNGNPLFTTTVTSITVGAVTITNSSFSVTGSTVSLSGTVPVSGTFWQATQPVSIGATLPVINTNVSTVTFNGTPAVNAAQSGAYRVDVSSIGGVAQSSGSLVDGVNNAWRVNVVQGAGGGGPAQLQVRDVTQTNQYVGWYTGGSSVPVVEIGTPAIKYNEPTTASLSVSSISFSATGDNVIVSTQSSQTVRVFRIMIVASAATTIEFKSGGATPLTGFMTLNTGGSVILDFTPEPWFVTGSGQAFIINQTGTAQISGLVQYTQS